MCIILKSTLYVYFFWGVPICRYRYAHTHIYMVIDLKVLVRSFNCENRACYVGNPRESFFEFAKVKFYFAKVSRKLGIIIIICKGLPPTAARGPAGEGHQRMRVAVAKFPKVRLCESQTPRPWSSLFLQCTPCWWPGSVNIGIFSRKFRESYAKERAKVKVHVEGGPVNFAKKICPEKGFRDASCMFKRLPRSDPWFSGVIWQVVNESS